MSQPFEILRQRLLADGIAPRHVHRYIGELNDHFADLRGVSASEEDALRRLGTVDDLARVMTERPEFRSWTARAPWAAMVLGPVVMMIATAVVVVVVILVIAGVWHVFSPWQWPHGVEPLGLQTIARAMLAGLVFVAPILIGWTMGVLAVQRRLAPLWPLIGLAVFAVLSGTFDAQVIFPKVAGERGELMLGFSWLNWLDPLDPMNISRLRWIANLILIVGPYLALRVRSRQAEDNYL